MAFRRPLVFSFPPFGSCDKGDFSYFPVSRISPESPSFCFPVTSPLLRRRSYCWRNRIASYLLSFLIATTPPTVRGCALLGIIPFSHPLVFLSDANSLTPFLFFGDAEGSKPEDRALNFPFITLLFLSIISLFFFSSFSISLPDAAFILIV